MITLTQPIWLLLAIPLAATLFIWPMPSRLLTIVRSMIITLIVLAMAGLSIELPSRSGTVVVAVDRSLSMPADADSRAIEAIKIINGEKGRDDKLIVLTFGRQTSLETIDGKLESFKTAVGNDASSYAEAVDRALSMIPAQSPGRVLILGDGRWTGDDPSGPAARAAARGIAIDHRLLERPATNDVAVVSIDAPQRVAPGESFMVSAFVQSPIPQEVLYELVRGNTVLARGRREMAAGVNRLVFRDSAANPGVHGYRLTVTGEGTDPVPENNRAKRIVGVDGPRPVLHLAPGESSGLASLLTGGKVAIQSVPRSQQRAINWSLDQLANYSAVLIENVPSQQIGEPGMELLAAWVRQTGSGIMMTGGQTSFGPGGYYKSPLEPVMPVSMELRREHRKLALAIMVVLDRSGSMSAPVAGGTKMDLANQASAEVLELLSAMDQFGVLAVDSSPHTIAELQPVTDKGAIRSKVLSIDSMGGGIFVYAGLSKAVEMLSKSNLGTRHIILFSDAQDSEQPGAYKELLRKATDAGMTVSVIGLGKDTDVDADLLRDIAKRGNGRVFFTEKASELPRLFAQDTFVVARSTFVDETTEVNITPGLMTLTGQAYQLDRPVGGYNLTYLREQANLAAVTTDEYAAPIIASWQVGSGRSVVYTGEADGRFTGPIAQWPSVGEMLTSLVRWTAGRDEELPSGGLLTQSIDSGVAAVTLHLDPNRTNDGFQNLPTVTVLRDTPTQPPTADTAEMRWVGPDTLEARIELTGDETAIATVEVGDATVSMPPVTLPYSPEFKPVDEQTGPATLTTLAQATGGVSRDILGKIWSDLPKRPRFIDIAPWLLLAAILLLLTEILERRSGVLGARRRAVLREQRDLARAEQGKDQPRSHEGTKPRSRKKKAKAEPSTEPSSGESAEPAKSAPTSEPTKPAPALGDALKAAQRRARGRTQGRGD
jgi:uncharacterized membrane protein